MKKVFKRIVALMIIALTVIAINPPKATAATWSGSGTESSPYLISNESALRQLATNVDSGTTYSGKYFRVTQDISLSQTWNPIGSSSRAFRGNFDGNNKTISGLEATGSYSGLFANLGSGAAVKNVNLTDFEVSGGEYLAGIAAFADAGSGSITITNCNVNGTLRDTVDSYPDGYLGGIVGYAKAESGSLTISDCTADGSNSCDYNSGGIIGYGKGKDLSIKITDCTNNAYIGAGNDGNNCGGIAGYLEFAEVTGCANYGSVSGNAYSEDNGSSWLGGIMGSGAECTFIGCANYGSVSTFFAGGITASQSKNTAISCLNVGSLSYSSDGYGAAIIRSGSAFNCYYNSRGSAITGATSVTTTELASGSVAYSLREYFGQELGVDDYPVPVTEDNRIYKVTVVGELEASFFANHGDTVEFPEISSCAAYFEGENEDKFDTTAPITRDTALYAKGYHNYVDGVCKYCGNDGVPYVDVGSCGDSVVWCLNNSGTLTISGSGSMKNYSASSPAPWAQYASSIKAVKLGQDVTAIGSYAFYGLDGITSIDFGSSVAVIGDYAFYGLTGMTSLTVSDSVTEIGDYAFASWTSLESLTIGKQVNKIGDYAFYQCGALWNANIPASVTEIGRGAFMGCTALERATLRDGLLKIGDYAFSETAIQEVTVPATVTEIGNYVFAKCQSLWYVTFMGKAPVIASNAFSGNTVNCYTPDYDSSWSTVVNKNYGGTLTWSIGGGSCGNSVKWVLDYTNTLVISGTGDMYGYDVSYGTPTAPWGHMADKVLKVVISEGVTKIGDYAFYGCSNMTSIEIANSVTKIGTEGYTSYGYGCCFYGCDSLKEITIPVGVTSVSEKAFNGCNNLTAITVSSSNTKYTSQDGILYSRYKDILYRYPCGKSGAFTIPSGVEEIADCAFSGSGLTSVTIPSSVTAIGYESFGNCDDLSTITFEGSAPTSLGSYDYPCTGVVADVYIPTSDTTWTTSVMNKFSGTLSWHIGSGTCGTNARWEMIYSSSSSTRGATLKISGSGAMSDYTSSSEVPWSAYSSVLKTVEIAEGITYIGDYTFDGTSSLTSVTLPDSVRTIGESAFSNTGIRSIDLPSSLQTVDRYAFYNCKSLTSLSFDKYLRTIGYTAFAGCTALESVDLGSSTSITLDQSAFNGCTKLKKIVIPSGVTSIGTYAFRNCTGLMYVEFLGNYPSINTDAFSGTTCHAYYLSSKSYWTSSNLVNYGGTITWGIISQRGTCGTNAEWILDTDGNLYICGSGSMTTYSESTKAPWYDVRSSIKMVTLRGVSSIGSYAFSGCNKITDITLSSSTNSVGTYAFADCVALDVVIFEGNGPSFGTNSFSGTECEVWYPSTASSWSSSMRQNYGGTLTWRSFTVRGNCGTNAKWALDSTGTLAVIGTGDMSDYSTTSSQPWYSNRSSINAVVIGDGITSIGYQAFSGCSSIKTVTIGQTVSTVDNYAFLNATGIESITFTGNAPTFNSSSFSKVTATVYYPLTDTTWTSSKRANYGGTLTWVAVCTRHNEVTDPAVEPTCTATGLTEGTHCSLCNEVFTAQEVVPAKGHYVQGPDGSSVPADTVEPDCVNAIKCTVCNKIAINAAGHRVLGTTLVETDPITITNSSSYPFSLDNGVYYSTNKNGNSTSELRITVQYDCSLTLKYGVSSEEDYDKLRIYLNGITKSSISGEVSEKTLTLTLLAGDYVVVSYSKDGSVNHGSDQGWVTLVYDWVMAEHIEDVPADTAEPGCTEGVVCRYCDTVIKEPVGHRVIIQDEAPEIPFNVVNESSVPFVLSDGVYYSENHGSSSSSELVFNITYDCTVTLNHGVSSETTHDKLVIFLNGTAKSTISGVVSDKILTLEVKAGDVITVRYSKDSSVNKNDDMGWVSVEYTVVPSQEIVFTDSLEAGCEDIICDFCNEVAKEALDHDITEWTVVEESTCIKAGTRSGECSRCGHVEYESIPMIDHVEEADPRVEATCTETGLTEGSHCSVCNTVIVKQNVIASLGHDETTHAGKSATCTEGGWSEYVTCSRCDYTTYEEIAPLGHDEITNEAKAATCTEGGWSEYVTCSRCDYTTYEEIAPLGHDEITNEAKAATCTEGGWSEYVTCSRCDYTTYEEIAPLGHDEITNEAKAATCTESGWSEYVTCSRCDYTTYEEIAPLGHDEITNEAKAATCTESGWSEYVTCSRCDYTTYEEIAPLGHSYENGSCTLCGKIKNEGEDDIVLGDIDGDGVVNGKDANVIKQYIAGFISLDEKAIAAADVNGDGTVNGVDANLIARYLAGAIGGF